MTRPFRGDSDQLAADASLVSAVSSASIIGHGERRKSAHDGKHDYVWVRRGRCRLCRKTFTILPSWSLPYAHYSRLQIFEMEVNAARIAREKAKERYELHVATHKKAMSSESGG